MGAAAAGARGSGFPPSPCILLPAVHAALGERVVQDESSLVRRVLQGLDPPPTKLWGVACGLWSQVGGKPVQLERIVRLLLPPEQARATVAAVAAADAQASA